MLRPTFPIETERLRLRPYRADDLDALHAIQSNAEVVRYLYWGVRTRDAVRDDLARRIRQDAIDREGDKLILALERRDGAGLVGDVNLVWVSREHLQGEIGFVLHPDHHGRGFAAEGAAVLLRLGFETLGLHRIIGRCDGRNVASVRVM